MEAGLSRETFMLRLEKEVEARSDALMREVGFDPDAKQN
jgi:1-acyl-sn-glycerol-3-phosphate acyltransferase